jgi:hypothetical protein
MVRRLLETRIAKKFLALWETHGHFFTGGALLLGFCFDLLIATRPDSPTNNLLLLTYLLVAGGIIVVLNVHKTRRMMDEHPVEPVLLLLMLQFLFGNLSSNLLVLYGRSGTLAGSALFLAILLAMLVGNEFLKTRYGQLRFTIAIYYILVFSYLIIAAPTFLFHDIGVFVFLATGLLSLAFIFTFLWAVYRFILRGKYRARQLFEVGAYVVGIYFAFNLFYFLNIIPPVPLSLKEIGVYHSVSNDGRGNYRVTYEDPPWFAFWRATSRTYHAAPGASAYCVSAVFAPTGISTPIVHSWEIWNDRTGKWEVRARITFPINGGRDGGYRGYSQKVITPGTWRCDVETEGGQLIGRSEFVAEQGPAFDLVSKTL